MGRKGPRGGTLDRVEKVRALVAAGQKLVWALEAVGLSNFAWYRWSGWRQAGPYRRTVRVCRSVLDLKEQKVRAYLAEGERLSVACRAARVSVWTMRYRLKKEVACE